MATALSLSEVTDDAYWDALVNRSPQGTVFSSSAFIRSLGQPVKRWLVSAGTAPLALCCAPETEDGTGLEACDYTPYQGILFVADPEKLARQRVHDEFKICEFFIQALTEKYRHISMPMSWEIKDIRAFQWHNYHEPERGQFTLIPRYTAVLELDNQTETSILAQARSCRRQEYRKTAQFPIHDYQDADIFIEQYQKTFFRQDIEVTPEKLALVRSIAEHAVCHGYGRLSGCETPDGLASMTLFLYDKQRAYYLFAANDPALRHTGAATRLMFDNILHAQERGLSEVDFVGVNSPNRGDFKLSFNPDLRLYFHAVLQA